MSEDGEMKCPKCEKDMVIENGILPYCTYCGNGMSAEQIMDLTGEPILGWGSNEGWKS